MNYIQFEGKILRRQWKLLGEIGRGKHSVIYAAQNLVTGLYAAVKIEESQVLSRLQNEAQILYQLQGAKNNNGISKVYWVGVDNILSDYNFIIFELLGPSLQILFNICDKKFSMKTVLMIAIQSLQIIENLHNQNFIHCDIKPSNFLMGLNEKSYELFLIDFGMSKQFKDSHSGLHIQYKEKQNLVGNPKFMSINNHYNIEYSRRDDLESLAYTLIYFAKGGLPWESKKIQNTTELYQVVCEEKQKTIMEEFCQELPHIFIIFLNYARNLSFSQTPDYLFLKSLFEDYFTQKGYTFDFRYDWTSQININNTTIEQKKYNIAYEDQSDKDDSIIGQNEQCQKIDPSQMLQSQNYKNNRKSSFSIRRQDTQKSRSNPTSESSIGQNSYNLTDSDIKLGKDSESFKSLDQQNFPEEKKESKKEDEQKVEKPKTNNDTLKPQFEELDDLRRTTSKKLKQYKSLDSKNNQNKNDKSIQKSKSGKEGQDSNTSEENTISKLIFSEDQSIVSDFEIEFSNESFKFQINLNKIFDKLIIKFNNYLQQMKSIYLFILLMIDITYGQPSNYCINGVNPSYLNNKDYLIEFSQGNCSPVIIIPPLTGSRLFLQILDCDYFKESNPYIFKTCGWTHCTKRSYEFWKKVPRSEYPVWLSDIGTPMNILSPYEQSSNCLAALMNVPVDFTKEAPDAIIETKGYRITYGGNTPGTVDRGNCGERACNEIFPDQIQPVIKLEYWKAFLDPMRDRGYRRGLTYQFIPYDFRLSIQNNELNKLFVENLERIYKITGKKVYIVSLSYGVNNTYYQITKLNKEQKKMIKGFIGMGGNYAGVSMGDFSILAPLNFYGIWQFKLHYDAALFLQSHMPSVFENATMNPFQNFKNEPFMQEIRKRMLYEQGSTENDESIFSEFLPQLEDKCSPENYEHFGNTCKLGMNDPDNVVMQIGEEQYTRENLGEMYKKWGNSEDIYKLWEKFQQKKFEELQNPGVPIIALTMRTCSTPIKYQMPSNMKEMIQKKEYINPEIEMGHGDCIVDALSLFIGPLKWAYEYKMKTVEDVQPVKIVDVCGLYNQGKPLYDSIDDKGEKIMTDNDFVSLECSCMNSKNPFGCSHSGMFRDSKTGELFAKLIESNEKSYSKEYVHFIYQFDNYELDQMAISQCPQVKYKFEETKKYTLNFQLSVLIKYFQQIDCLILLNKQINIKYEEQVDEIWSILRKLRRVS